MNISDKSTVINVLISVLWLACMLLGWSNQHVIGMCVGVVLMYLYMLLGVSKQGISSKSFVVYPMGIWAVLWILSFVLNDYFAVIYAGQVAPAFLGFHPSFAPTIFLYWIGGMLTLSLGFVLKKDEWMSQKDWDDFCVRMKKIKEANNG